MQGYTPEHSDIYCPEFSYLFHTQRATLFIPETAVADVRAMFSRPTWSFRTLFSLKTYSGDVHSAQEPVRRQPNRSAQATYSPTR